VSVGASKAWCLGEVELAIEDGFLPLFVVADRHPLGSALEAGSNFPLCSILPHLLLVLSELSAGLLPRPKAFANEERQLAEDEFAAGPGLCFRSLVCRFQHTGK
jgi:hypothetical protein